ncbi:MAG: hypothetical protein QMD71_08505 [bacterium]|nr:hypothetical protein [bacterium]
MVDKEVEPGYYGINWDAIGFLSGIYFSKLVAVKCIFANKLILMEYVYS